MKFMTIGAMDMVNGAEHAIDIGFVYTRIMDGQGRTLLNQLLTDGNCWAFPNIFGIRLKGKTQNRNSFITQSAIKLLINNLGNPMLGPIIKFNHRAPIVGDWLQSKMFSQVDKIERISFLKQLPPKPGPGCKKLDPIR